MPKNEIYKTTVRYYDCRDRKDQRYITIELPADTIFNPDDRVEISITQIDREFVSTATNNKRITAGSIMRQMDVGDKATFNISQWLNIRTIASQIKDMYGSTYRVTRDKKHPENVIVVRLS